MIVAHMREEEAKFSTFWSNWMTETDKKHLTKKQD